MGRGGGAQWCDPPLHPYSPPPPPPQKTASKSYVEEQRELKERWESTGGGGGGGTWGYLTWGAGGGHMGTRNRG